MKRNLKTIHKDPLEHSANENEICVHGEISETNMMDETGSNMINAENKVKSPKSTSSGVMMNSNKDLLDNNSKNGWKDNGKHE